MHSDPERADEFLSSRASVAMVATSNAPEERRTLLDPDPAPTRSSGRGSFARYATAGTFLAGLAVAAVTTSGTADASAITRVKLGDASADLPGHPQHAEAVGHRLTPEAVRWWHEHHPKQPVLGDFDEMGKRASVNTDEKSGAHDEDVASTGKRETDALSSSSSSSKKYVASADDSIGDISIGEAGADKSQDMFSHLFGDGNPAPEVRVPSAAVLHDPAEAKEDEALVSEFGAADEIIKTHDHSHKKHSHEKHSHEKHSHEKHSHEKHSHKKHFHEKHSHEKHSHEKHSHEKHSHDEKHSHEKHSDKKHSHKKHSSGKKHFSHARSKNASSESSKQHKGKSHLADAFASEDDMEKWFAQQREIIAAEYEKEMTEKLKDAEKKTTKKVKAAKKAKKESESDRPDSSSDVPTDPSSPLEWFVSFTVTHVEKDEEIPCGESHAAEVEELVGQIAGTAGIEPRLMRVGTCENLNKKKREFEVSFSVGDVEDTDEEIASARAKDMVKLFSNDAVRAMLMVDGKDESEAKRATSEFKVEASRVEFDRRPKETMPPPDFTAPVPLSSEHAGHFHVGGAQTDAQIKRMLAQVAVDRGMPSDNIPNINIEKCPFDYHVTFDVSVLGFGCPGGDAANDGQFAKQYKSYMYKFAELADPPLVLPDTVAVSDCVPPSRQSDDEGESQSFTVSFDVPRASERTDPARLAKEVMNLFDVDNIRQHAADVGVSAHLLHQMGVDARTSKNRVALVLDPWSRPCNLAEVVFDGEVPEGLVPPPRTKSVEKGAADAKDFIEAHEAADSEEAAAELAQKVGEMDPAGGRAQMLQELARNVGGGFKTSSGGPARE